ncbi:hypothetical protein GCM10009037_27840 [Halarchaeum grantii]|uniref:Uncharacterized protein n=1 Tax=Halarchaeum grantii TaxID=1193105 RepID=A0A830EYL1_9EURY|nr:hypothetical protein [Halarchaeum grantii]GGL42729.1 hypothetical protein GCM10009037_27840 [Halarchaeum grantii]
MGLKSGSRDSGLDDAEDADVEGSDGEEVEESVADAASDAGEPAAAGGAENAAGTETDAGGDASAASDTSSDAAAEAEGSDDRPSMSSIPYKLRRNKVNEGREQVPYFLREDVIAGEEDLQDTLEDALGETVYKSDYREAAMVVAQRNPELIADVLREWGYDLDAE